MPAERTCRCGQALAHAIVTDRKLIPAAAQAAAGSHRRKIYLLRIGEPSSCPYWSLVRLHSMPWKRRTARWIACSAARRRIFPWRRAFSRTSIWWAWWARISPRSDEAIFRGRRIDIAGLERAEGKTFFWAGRYGSDPNERVTLATELNVFATFQPKLPETFRKPRHVFLANIDPTLQHSVLEQINGGRAWWRWTP